MVVGGLSSGLCCSALCVWPQLKGEESHVFKPVSAPSAVCFMLPRPETQRVICWRKKKKKKNRTERPFCRCTLHVQFVVFPARSFSTAAISHFFHKGAAATRRFSLSAREKLKAKGAFPRSNDNGCKTLSSVNN